MINRHFGERDEARPSNFDVVSLRILEGSGPSRPRQTTRNWVNSRIIFIGVTAAVLVALPTASRTLTRTYGYRTPAIRTKCVVFILLGFGFVAL